MPKFERSEFKCSNRNIVSTFQTPFPEKMADKINVDLRKIENYVINKEKYSQEVLFNEDKKSSFRKACKNFAVVNAPYR